MKKLISKLIDDLSNFFAHRKGLLPLIAVLLVITNYLLRITCTGFIVESDLFLHLGILLAIFGLMLARSL